MKKIIHIVIDPLHDFLKESRLAGVLLLLATVLSLLFSNLPLTGQVYRNIWNQHMEWTGFLHLPATLLEWINNFLMSIFFLSAGMEIKREVVNGELSSFRKALLPVGAALGGMLVPALLYTWLNRYSGYHNGWAIASATDIAFSLGIASLLGKKVPVSLRLFLVALAIMDDLGAILIIALFYGNSLQWGYIWAAIIVYVILWLGSKKKRRWEGWYIISGLLLWYLLLRSGIEAAISGVLLAWLMPADRLPVIERAVHKYVNFIILPLFALANTTIVIPAQVLHLLTMKISMGIIIGLCVGKPLGVFLFSRLLVLSGAAELPDGIRWNQLLGAGFLAGIGFTMSLFISVLAFSNEELQAIAKAGVLAGLLFSIITSVLYFKLLSSRDKK